MTNEGTSREQAAEALSEVARRQTDVIDLATIPAWYWWAVGLLMVALALGVDSKRPVEIGAGTSVFVVGLLASTGFVLFRGVRSAQLRNDLLGTQGIFAILGFVAAVVGMTLGIAFTLRASNVNDPATIACAAGGVLMGIGGPFLMRALRKTMLANRVGNTR